MAIEAPLISTGISKSLLHVILAAIAAMVAVVTFLLILGWENDWVEQTIVSPLPTAASQVDRPVSPPSIAAQNFAVVQIEHEDAERRKLFADMRQHPSPTGDPIHVSATVPRVTSEMHHHEMADEMNLTTRLGATRAR